MQYPENHPDLVFYYYLHTAGNVNYLILLSMKKFQYASLGITKPMTEIVKDHWMNIFQKLSYKSKNR